MKKLFITAFICVMLVSVQSFAAGIRADFKDYEIEKVDVYLGKKVSDVWKLNYGNEEKAVTVVKRTSLEGTEYVVHSKYFEVSYINNSVGFGVKHVRSAWSNVPKRITKAVINEEQMKRQQIISPRKLDDEKALGLIASYLPELINDAYTHVLN